MRDIPQGEINFGVSLKIVSFGTLRVFSTRSVPENVTPTVSLCKIAYISGAIRGQNVTFTRSISKRNATPAPSHRQPESRRSVYLSCHCLLEMQSLLIPWNDCESRMPRLFPMTCYSSEVLFEAARGRLEDFFRCSVPYRRMKKYFCLFVGLFVFLFIQFISLHYLIYSTSACNTVMKEKDIKGLI